MKFAGIFVVFLVAFAGISAQTLAPAPLVANPADCLLGILQTIADVLFGIGNAIFTVGKTLIIAVLKAFSGAIAFLRSLINGLPDLPSMPQLPTLPPTPDLSEFLNIIPAALKSFLDGIQNAVDKLTTLLSSFTLPPLPSLPPLPNPVEVIGALIGFVKDVIHAILDIFKRALALLPPLSLLGDILGAIKNAIGAVISWLCNIPVVLFNAISQIFTVLIPYIGSFFASLIKGIISGVLPLPTPQPGGLITVSVPTLTPTLANIIPTIPKLTIG